MRVEWLVTASNLHYKKQNHQHHIEHHPKIYMLHPYIVQRAAARPRQHAEAVSARTQLPAAPQQQHHPATPLSLPSARCSTLGSVYLQKEKEKD